MLHDGDCAPDYSRNYSRDHSGDYSRVRPAFQQCPGSPTTHEAGCRFNQRREDRVRQSVGSQARTCASWSTYLSPVTSTTTVGSRREPCKPTRRCRRFFAAVRDGDFDTLLAVLDPDVVLRSDGGRARPGESTVVRGAVAVASGAVRFARLAPYRACRARQRQPRRGCRAAWPSVLGDGLHHRQRTHHRDRHPCRSRPARRARFGRLHRQALSDARVTAVGVNGLRASAAPPSSRQVNARQRSLVMVTRCAGRNPRAIHGCSSVHDPAPNRGSDGTARRLPRRVSVAPCALPTTLSSPR